MPLHCHSPRNLSTYNPPNIILPPLAAAGSSSSVTASWCQIWPATKSVGLNPTTETCFSHGEVSTCQPCKYMLGQFEGLYYSSSCTLSMGPLLWRSLALPHWCQEWQMCLVFAAAPHSQGANLCWRERASYSCLTCRGDTSSYTSRCELLEIIPAWSGRALGARALGVSLNSLNKLARCEMAELPQPFCHGSALEREVVIMWL